jgi:penicillin-binding protein 1A
MSTALHKKRRRKGRGRGRNKALLALMVVLIAASLAMLSLVGYVVSIAATAPALSSIKPRQQVQTSQVFAADGKRLGFIAYDELRRPVPGERIPQVLKDATVAIEDERFYKHKGVDYTGVIRAAVQNVTSGKTVQGGSTITMQLVRNLYISKERTYQRKIREAKLAEELENERSKEWILDEYINIAPYGTVNGLTAVGAEAASRVYFGKPVDELNLQEAAMIAGLPQAPSEYSPVNAPEKALARRNEVLAKMAELRMITREEAIEAIGSELGVKATRYFTNRREKYVFDYVKDELIKAYGLKTVQRGGLRVHTTIDLELQRFAREAIAERLGAAGPSAAIVSVDPRNGHIVAMASSSDYGVSKFNLAAQGHRQPGSSFKTMALLTALRRGVDPDATGYVSRPFKVDDPQWGPIEVKTYDNSYGGYKSLRQATLSSDNVVYIQLALDLGPEEIKRTAVDMGITSKLNGYPAESLGGLEFGVSPLEMANAYATIASGGYRNRATAIDFVVLPDGTRETLPRFKEKKVKVFEDGVTYEATKILEANVQGGTGTKAQIGCPAAGKTGTTDEHSDGWFVGYTPRLSTAVWVGYPKSQVHMTTEYYGGPVAGGTFPAEIWGAYMKRARRNYCGQWKTPTEPFRSVPFFGKYSKTGSRSDTDYSYGTPGSAATPDAEATKPDEGAGQDNGGGEFDPNLYESPPQESPPTQAPEDGGGAEAPPDGDG